MNIERKADILLVDDEGQIRRLLRYALEEAGYNVREAETGRIALGEIALQPPDLVILDLGLPDASGVDVLRAMRPQCSAPVLILSVLGHEKSKIAALDAGADDYLVKPFSSGELLAHLRALLRRIHAPVAVEKHLSFGPIQIDLVRSRVLCGGREVKLTKLEYKLLRLLVVNHDKVLTHRFILNELWGPMATQNTNYLRIYMMRLRRKLGEAVDSSGHFQTESGVGYRFVSEPAPGGYVL
ncbi:MAG TPA: response regulator [Opitutaceae bacterium]|jgi:two-component system KDP operon response regulator KdpE|nr:response regulator [Opitutaceae bacterium]